MTIKKPEPKIKKPRTKKMVVIDTYDAKIITTDPPASVVQLFAEILEIPECGLSIKSQPKISDENLLKSIDFRTKFFKLRFNEDENGNSVRLTNEDTNQQKVDRFATMNLAENLHLLDLVPEHVAIGQAIYDLVESQRRFMKAKKLRSSSPVKDWRETNGDICIGRLTFNILVYLYDLLDRAYHEPRVHVFPEFLRILVDQGQVIRGNHECLVYVLKIIDVVTSP